jgi:hypothetical protein
MTRARDYSQGGITGGGGGTSNVTLASLLPFLTTSNVAQRDANLYFSNALSFANLQLASLNDLLDVSIKSNTGIVLGYPGQGLIWTGNIWSVGDITANLAVKTTDDLNEGLSNLYYTNSRSRTAFTAADPTIIIDWNAGTIRANIAAVSSAGANTTDGLPEGFTNKYFSKELANAWAATSKLDIFGDVDFSNPNYLLGDGKALIYQFGEWRPGDIVAKTTDFANVAQEANVVLSISNFTTANLTEFGNLYYTDERVYSNIANLSIDSLADVWTPANSKITGYVLAWDGIQWYPQSTANIGNVGASFSSLFAERSGLANVALIANQANTSYYANVAGFVNFAFRANIANVANYANYAELANNVLASEFAVRAGTVSSLANFTSDDLREGNINLYFTDHKVLANVQQMRLDTFYDVSVSVANAGSVLVYDGTNWVPGDTIIEANKAAFSERANVANTVLTLSNFNTNDLQEGSNNLYYTTTRLTNDIQSAIYGKDIELDDLILFGDLTVRGNTVLLNVTNVRTESRVLTLADAANGPSDAEGSGIFINGANARLSYGEGDDGFGLNKNLVIRGNLIPALDGVFSIGSATRQWRDLYLGATTLYVGGISIGSDAGGLVVKDRFGNAAGIQLSNVAATQSVTVNRLYSNVIPLTEFNSYIGGNVSQFVSGQTANLYLGILKGGDFNKFAGMRIVETKDGSSSIRSDLHFYTDDEARANSRSILSLLGTGNVVLTANVVTINNIPVLDNRGNFVGNSFLGTRDVDITHGGTGANTTQDARRNLFGDMTAGLIVKYGAANTLGPVSLVQGTGVTITNGDGQAGNPTIAIGQAVATTDSVRFANVTVNGTLFSNDITSSFVTVDGNLTVKGDFTVQGKTTQLDTQIVNVSNSEIVLNYGFADISPILDAYITVDRGNQRNSNIRWNETIDRWQFTNDGTNYFNIPIPSEYDNVIYDISISNGSLVNNGANVVLTGKKAGNVVQSDKIEIVGSGLVDVRRTSDDIITINAGIAPIVVTNVEDNTTKIIDQFPINQYRSVKYVYTLTTTAFISGGPQYGTGEILVMHDGVDPFITQYGMMTTVEDDIVNFSTNINNGNIRILAQATSGTVATVKFTGTTYTAV